MAGPEDIIIQISLAGDEDVASALRRLGETGSDAFDKMEKSLSGVSSVLGTIAKTFAVAGTAAIGIGTAFLEMSRRSTDATEAMNNLATQSGNTIESMSALKGAIASMGADTSVLAGAFRRLSITIEIEWAQITKSIKDSKDLVINNQQAIIASTLSVAAAEDSLAKARVASATARGVTLDPEIQARRDLRAVIRSVEEAENNLAIAKQKRAEAAKKDDEDSKNSILAVGAAVRSVIDGMSSFGNASKRANLELQNVIKGILFVSGEASVDALKNFNGGLADIANQAPDVQVALLKIADFMKNSRNATLNTALAMRLFGRQVGQDFISALSNGSEAIKANIAEMRRFGLVLTDTDKKVATEFKTAFSSISSILATVVTQIGNLFAPAFTRGFNLLIDVIKRNREAILAWAQSIANVVQPVIEDFFRILTGNADSIKTKWVKTLVDAFANIFEWITVRLGPALNEFFKVLSGERPVPGWITTIANTFTNILLPAIDAIRLGLDKLAAVITKVTGLKISGDELGVVLLVTQLTGLNAIILTLATSFATMLVAATVALGPAGLVLLAALAIGAFLGWNFQPVVEKSKAAWDALNAQWSVSPWETLKSNWDLFVAGLLGVGSIVLALGALVGWPATLVAAFVAAGIAIGANWDEIVATATAVFARLAEIILAPFVWIVTGVKTDIDRLVTFFSELPARVTSALSGLPEAMAAPFRAAVDLILGVLNPLADLVNRIVNSIRGTPTPQIAGGGGGSGLASGGLFRGAPGRDTNLAWLTDLEYVMRPAAVKKYGVNFMNMVNGLQLPRGFSMGGLVDNMSRSFSAAAIPGFADGGLNMQAASHMTVDLRTNAGTFRMVAPQETAKSLHHYAVTQKYQRAGRSPNWRGS
jgi:hypothetical protein